MKLLVISDIHNWSSYEKFTDKINPDLIILAGDLVACGTAEFCASNLVLQPLWHQQVNTS